MKQVQKTKQARPKPQEEPDTRTPSGRRLPY